MSTLLIVGGYMSIGIALLIIHKKIKEVTIGGNAGRFVAVLCVAVGYSFFAEKLSAFFQWNINVGGVFRLSVIIILLAAIVYYGIGIVKEWKKESADVIKKSTLWLGVAVALLIAARFFFAAGLK